MTSAHETDVAVVGGGPAGLGAAIAARRQGARVILLDASPQPGGQYWMQPSAPSTAAQVREGAARIAEARAAGVTVVTGAEVWAAWPDRRLSYVANGDGGEIQARAIVVATGTHDRPAAFPGWTLPGVMTPGAAQRLLKLHGTPPGRRVVLAGSGPFLLVVAAQLRAAGIEVAALVEAAQPTARLLAACRFPSRLAEMARLVRGLRGIPRRFGSLVVAAEGTQQVERVYLAPCRGNGRIDRERTEILDGIDALLVGYGFRPRTELATLLGCRHAYDAARGGWHVAADPVSGATGVAGVFAAGEVTGIGGARPSWLGGLAAGSAAAASLGFGRAVIPSGLGRARRFAAWVGSIWAPTLGLGALADDDTILCRCEDVTVGTVASAIADGARTGAAVKMWTRCGMGRCQGRICAAPLADLLQHRAGIDPPGAGCNEARIPLCPVPLDAVRGQLET